MMASGRADRVVRNLLALAFLVCGGPAVVHAQLGSLASPGPLTRAHASLEGLANCQKCHEPGRRVAPSRCLACHKPIAERIAKGTGVHRDAGGDCVTCHVEHAGLDAELRPLDRATFDHAGQTQFPLDGVHARLARDCASCHKTRSFLTASPSCASCHRDPHNGSLGSACATCHSTRVAFRQAAKSFDHSKTAFPLTGAHQRLACATCHIGGRFRGLAFEKCTACHKDPHQQKFGTACATCHTTDTFRTILVDHAKTAFPLVGLHRTVPCARCHLQPATRVKPRATTCADCHSDPHRGQFKEACSRCHTENGFKTALGSFDHAARTGFALTGRHAVLPCATCHAPAKGATPSGSRRAVEFKGLNRDCASCHSDPHKGQLGTTCENCHATASFRVTSYTHPRQPEFFAGEHTKVTCAACHRTSVPTAPARTGAPLANVRFKGVPFDCASCHADPHLGQLGAACNTCHSVNGARFAASGFQHARSSFPLTGAHEQVPCAKCHKSETGSFPAGQGTARRFKGVPTACASCHADPHLGQLGTECATCHTTSTFAVRNFTHRGLDGFFVGRHATLECAQCHKPKEASFPAGRGTAVNFKTGTECSACHRDAHRGTLGTGCATCHLPDRWQNPNRAFHKVTVFPLQGRHLTVPCASCHENGQLKGTPTRCYDCHWVRRQDDLYKTRLGVECEGCHRPTTWTAVRWDHGAQTGLPLNAAHKALACDSCHRNATFGGSRPECVSCHEADYRAARAPNHVAAGFPLQCDVCHRPSAPTFAGATFAHASFTLVGRHATESCVSCHRNDVYRGTPRDCFSCHETDYGRTTNPNHTAAGFPTACETCHRASDATWQSGRGFNHASVFPLQGSHASAACTACHRNGQYEGTPRECYSCHQADYQRTTNPNHASAGYSTACESCHRSGGPGWAGANINHSQFFPLLGTHSVTACTACHRNGQYKGTPRDCFPCHESQYQNATNPNHVAAAFPTNCSSCHRSGGPGWASTFNHSTVFALVGVHASQACTACHRNNTYEGTPRTCVGCHLSSYQATRDPSHVAAGFPTTCDSCHRASDTSWSQGRFTHSWFPITSGAHANRQCRECHADPNNFKVFSCTVCHDRARTDAKHEGRAGYRYDSVACYSCHPNGRGD